ncbi:hypothetical protein E2C06_33510 [Dankookia rubra]|uniref:Uncharacterized protein n=1 Tax=Dankookia rubra TaxID=1442381 RepID=A0A4R5Q836_9PROT|nr:hypothetical protein [Dankookia rubra]TDH58267.1 hypothetical protein E2C06_33510 [Dankookia rubra]
MSEDTATAAAAETAPGNAPARSSRRRRQAAASSDKRQQPRTVSARLTDAAYADLVARADAAGLGPSTYVAQLIEADLGTAGTNRRWVPRQAPSETRDRAVAVVRELGRLTGALLHWLSEARTLGVDEDAINQVGRLTPVAREALADARAAVRDLRGQ